MNMTQWLSFSEVRKMRKGTNSYDVYNFPFTEVAIGIRVLTQDEVIMSTNTGRDKASKLFENPTNELIMDLSTRELLYKSVITVTSEEQWESKSEDFTRFFSSAEDVWELSMDEITTLLEHYNEVQEKYAPISKLETPEDFEKLIWELKKKSRLGMSLSTLTLRKLLQYSISNPLTSQNDNGIGSSPASQTKETMKEKNLPELNEKKLGLTLEENK